MTLVDFVPIEKATFVWLFLPGGQIIAFLPYLIAPQPSICIPPNNFPRIDWAENNTAPDSGKPKQTRDYRKEKQQRRNEDIEEGYKE